MAWVYLDIGEIYDADEDGFPVGDHPLFFLDTPDDAVGTLAAAAPEMAEALRAVLAIEPANVGDDEEQAAAFAALRAILAKIGGSA